MNSFHNYIILKEEKLVILYFSGLVYLDIAVSNRQMLMNDPEYDKQYNSIVDFRDAELKFTEVEIETFIEFLKNEKP